MKSSPSFPSFPFRFSILLETAAVFVVLYAHGAWPVPDVNESYYLGKAIHFWNPDWVIGDSFLDSKDAHWCFYAVFGWLSLFLSPNAFAWTGRVIVWAAFAWGWRRLSFALIPVRWLSIPTAAGLLYYLDAFQMSGEWVIGGVEGKSFAYPLVLFGLEAMVRGKWNRVWGFFGAAAAFHVLVGGWSVIVGLFVWSLQKRTERTSLRKMLPFLGLGGLLSLPGLIPALLLDSGCSRETIGQAHWIYVFERLGHHLVPSSFPWTYRLRFAVLVGLWLALCWVARSRKQRAETASPEIEETEECELAGRFFRLHGFVFGTLILAAIGFGIAALFRDDPRGAADWLRFYWFRMSDFAVPLGVTFLGTSLLYRLLLGFEKQRNESSNTPLVAASPVGDLAGGIGRILALLGIGVGVFLLLDGLIFGWLFFTWFPPPEPAIPWGVTMILGIVILVIFEKWSNTQKRPPFKSTTLLPTAWLLLLVSIVVWGPLGYILKLAEPRTRFAYSRSDPSSSRAAYYWVEACDWINDPANGIPKEARFLTPGDNATFKWYTARPEVATWKEIPQDAAGIVRWYETVEELFAYRPQDGPVRRDYSLQVLLNRYPPGPFQKLREKYEFDYVLCGKYPALQLPILYENMSYVIYDAKGERDQPDPIP